MKCDLCEQKPVMKSHTYSFCKDHFIKYFVWMTNETIKKFDLLEKHEKICIATSGGKDSLAITDVLYELGYNFTCLLIDEGIDDYREHSIIDLKKYVADKNISYRIVSFKDEYGVSLDEGVKKNLFPCTLCGTWRRYLLNKYSKDFDVLVTGHNLDDEAQTILINLFRANTDLLLRIGPKTEPKVGFTRRIKPFYFLSEKEIRAYVLLKGIEVHFTECPYANIAYRDGLRLELNKLEEISPGTKKNIVETFLALKNKKQIEKTEKSHYDFCQKCGEPSEKEICKSCKLKNDVLN